MRTFVSRLVRHFKLPAELENPLVTGLQAGASRPLGSEVDWGALISFDERSPDAVRVALHPSREQLLGIMTMRTGLVESLRPMSTEFGRLMTGLGLFTEGLAFRTELVVGTSLRRGRIEDVRAYASAAVAAGGPVGLWTRFAELGFAPASFEPRSSELLRCLSGALTACGIGVRLNRQAVPFFAYYFIDSRRILESLLESVFTTAGWPEMLTKVREFLATSAMPGNVLGDRAVMVGVDRQGHLNNLKIELHGHGDLIATAHASEAEPPESKLRSAVDWLSSATEGAELVAEPYIRGIRVTDGGQTSRVLYFRLRDTGSVAAGIHPSHLVPWC